MGYLTLHDIHIETGEHSPRAISRQFLERFDANELGILCYESSSERPFGTLDFDGIVERKWYEEQEDMSAFSRQFPTAIFTVHCTGENPGDIWEHRYLNGRIQRREMGLFWGDWEDV